MRSICTIIYKTHYTIIIFILTFCLLLLFWIKLLSHIHFFSDIWLHNFLAKVFTGLKMFWFPWCVQKYFDSFLWKFVGFRILGSNNFPTWIFKKEPKKDSLACQCEFYSFIWNNDIVFLWSNCNFCLYLWSPEFIT